MRALIMLTGLSMAGCVGQPSGLQPNSVIAQAPAAVGAGAPAAVETQRVAAAKRLNLKASSKDGQQLYCRSNLITGSHIQKDTRCYTAEQVDIMDREIEREVDQFRRTRTPGALGK